MTEKKRLTALAAGLKLPDNEPTIARRHPHGEKGDYVKVSVTLPPEVYELVAKETVRRKMRHEPEPNLSAVIREAIIAKYCKG